MKRLINPVLVGVTLVALGSGCTKKSDSSSDSNDNSTAALTAPSITTPSVTAPSQPLNPSFNTPPGLGSSLTSPSDGAISNSQSLVGTDKKGAVKRSKKARRAKHGKHRKHVTKRRGKGKRKHARRGKRAKHA